MSLINKILKKDQTKEYFLTLGVEEHRISASAALLSDNTVSIVGNGESEFREGDNEIEAADIAISTAEKNIPENILIKKVIFGLPTTYLDGDRIKPEYAKRLKIICKELNLEPFGYVEYPSAINFYLENKEESPPTLLLLSVGRNKLILSLIRVGKVEHNIAVDRTPSLSTDFEKILTHFTSEILPSRIMIYDEVKGIQLEEFKEELLKFPWHKYTTFLHTPKIEILPDNAINIALVESAGGTIIKEIILEEKSEIIKEKSQTDSSPVDDKKEYIGNMETFGFAENKDIKEESASLPIAGLQHDNLINPTIPEDKPKISLPKLPKITISLPNFSNPFNNSSSILPLISFIGLLLITAIYSFFIFWTFPKSTVNLIVYPLSSSQNREVAFVTDPKIKTDNKTILVREISEDVNGNKSTPASGKTKVGDKAKGEIIIYNKTTSSKALPKGTALTNGSLKFTLDDDVNIASASDTGEGLTFGKVTAKITSSDIGPEGNLAAGSVFGFKDFPQSSFLAKNPGTLTGGTEREVSSVSSNDQNKLLNSLSLELESQAKQKIMQKLGNGEKILDQINDKIVSKKFNKDVDSEAKEVNLNLSLTVSAVVYKEEDLKSLIDLSQFTASSGYTIDNSRIGIRITGTKVDKKGNTTGTVVFTANFLPDIDKNKVRANIKGKSISSVIRYLSSQQEIGGVEIINDQSLPILNNILPRQEKNININIIPR